MAYNISKYLGIPASLKTAKKQLKEITSGKNTTIRVPKGEYLCIIEKPDKSEGFDIKTYPIIVQKTKKAKGSLVCRRMPKTYYRHQPEHILRRK